MLYSKKWNMVMVLYAIHGNTELQHWKIKNFLFCSKFLWCTRWGYLDLKMFLSQYQFGRGKEHLCLREDVKGWSKLGLALSMPHPSHWLTRSPAPWEPSPAWAGCPAPHLHSAGTFSGGSTLTPCWAMQQRTGTIILSHFKCQLWQ